jgi:hypothetical protein
MPPNIVVVQQFVAIVDSQPPWTSRLTLATLIWDLGLQVAFACAFTFASTFASNL